MSSIAMLIGRVLLSLIFIQAGLSKLMTGSIDPNSASSSQHRT